MKDSNISNRIVQFAIDTKSTDLSSTAMQVLRLSLVDWMAVAIAGVDEPVANITRALVEHDGGAEDSFALGLSSRVPARAAALVNGAIGHALDYDDTHFASLGHPSVAVIPAVLAVADRINASQQQAKEAALIGMEIAVRTGVWLGREHYRTGFHVTGTAGTFGATMAVARLLGLNHQQSHHALGIAASRASGVKAQFGTMGKPMHAGFAASNGVESALLAQLGFIAGENALGSSQGFAKTHHGEFNDNAFDDAGGQFLFENVSHKFHACCHGTHAAIEAMQTIRDQYQIEPDSVRSIAITVHPQYLDICNITAPSTGLQAKFSYHMAGALVMNRFDTARIDTFNDSICSNITLRKIQDCVRLHTNPDLAETSAEAIITLSNGDKFHQTHDLLKSIELPQRELRVRAKCESILGTQQANNLWSQVAQGETLPTTWLSEYFNASGTPLSTVG